MIRFESHATMATKPIKQRLRKTENRRERLRVERGVGFRNPKPTYRLKRTFITLYAYSPLIVINGHQRA